MSFSDPQSITINAVAVPLPRTSTGVNSSNYTSADGNVRLTASHQYNARRTRRTIRVDHSKISADPLLTNVNARSNTAVYVVVDQPNNGSYSATEVKQIVDGLTAYLTASSGSAVTKLLGGEN